MITHLRGKLIEKNNRYLIIDCSGIGYYLNISLYTNSLLSNKKGENICIYTYLLIKENEHILYGFFDKIERKIFIDLISVNGIGPNLAIILLSSLNPYKIIESIYRENINVFNEIKGIGKKIAHKIIIELKDKICKKYNKGKNLNFNEENLNFSLKKETLKVLSTLGFNDKNNNIILNNILNKNPNFSVESLVKEFIKIMNKNT
ncbi:Holliday junction branch migration protein RuvA [Blattabacterium cuenoti]|uniref:Holliday junction branch migration protein RuvA n=1 Tax=Blattabacterium cuenoti TaxID=1653831 RepID=UPI00163BDB8A|nr:Holliday junction branch migration protein RuvA [Blattabacterium cuenoti]